MFCCIHHERGLRPCAYLQEQERVEQRDLQEAGTQPLRLNGRVGPKPRDRD